MNLKPSIRHQLREYLIASLFLVGITFLILLIMVGSLLFAKSSPEPSSFSNISYSGYEMSCYIFLFVYGIILPRQVTRLCVQMGVSRRTAFLSLFPPLLIASLILVLTEKGIFAMISLISKSIDADIQITHLFSLLYLNGNSSLTLAQHGQEILFNLFCVVAWFSLGLFFTFLFWRLNKFGCVIAGLAIPTILVGVPLLTDTFPTVFAPVISLAETISTLCTASPWWAITFALLFTLFFSAVSWLLIRRTNIRGSALTSK